MAFSDGEQRWAKYQSKPTHHLLSQIKPCKQPAHPLAYLYGHSIYKGNKQLKETSLSTQPNRFSFFTESVCLFLG